MSETFQDHQPHVAVVGGGVSGLVAALTLAKRGVRVSLFDAHPQLGGRICRVRLAGITLDTGAEAFATRNGTVVRYLEQLGLGGEIVTPAPIGSWVIAGRRAVPLPGGGTLGIPSRPLSRAAIRLLGLPGAVRAACEPLLPRCIGRNSRSLAALVRTRLGRAVLDRVVRPVTLGVYSTDPDQMSHSTIPALAAAYERSGSLLVAARTVRASTVSAGGAVAGLRGGMGSLIDALVTQSECHGAALHTSSSVHRLVMLGGGAAEGDSIIEVQDDHGNELARADAVILAVPQPIATRLMTMAEKDTGAGGCADRKIDGISKAGEDAAAVGDVEVVVLVLDDARLDSAPRGTGVLVAPSADGPIVAKALTHVTAKWPERAREAGPGRHVLRLSYGRVGDLPATTGMTDAQTQQLALSDASQILGMTLLESSVVAMRRARWAMSAPESTHVQRRCESLVPLGDWVSGTGLASVISEAEAAAEALAETLGSGSDRRSHALSAPNATKDPPTMHVSLPPSAAPGRVFRSDGPMDSRPGLIRIGTRGSALALTQTTTVARTIAAATGNDVALITVTTTGDVSRAPLAQLGGTGVFVSALRDALLEGACDVAVHSLKDLPTGPCPGIVIGAIPERADARDALCARDGFELNTLPTGARVGTGSPRRAAQLLARRPDLEVCELRGNVGTRLGRVGVDLDAVVLAAAGLDRISLDAAISERFPLHTVPTAPGQGALAVEVRSESLDQERYAAALAALDDPETHACALAERTLLGTLEAGCAAPIGAWARIEDLQLHLSAAVYRLDGSECLMVTQSRRVPDGSNETEPASLQEVAEALGAAVARELLAEGAAELAPLGSNRDRA